MEVLRHAIGKSTFAEGIAVPRHLESWVNAPSAGQKRSVTLHFGGFSAVATLRRLRNARGHVQIKYENKAGEAFRRWLEVTFSASQRAARGEYLELRKIGEDDYEVTAYPVTAMTVERLEIREWIFHCADEAMLERHAQIREIPAVVQSVAVVRDNGQDYYNRQLSHFFGVWKWDSERRIIPELPLKVDFMKDKVVVEVEFGNARTYYQDYVKFMLALNRRTAEIGVLIVPTEDFARCLCETGRRRAEARGRHTYSGMIHLEKVRRELQYLKFMLSGPIAIAGICMHASPV